MTNTRRPAAKVTVKPSKASEDELRITRIIHLAEDVADDVTVPNELRLLAGLVLLSKRTRLESR